MDLTSHLQMLVGLGAATLLAGWMPSVSHKLRVSYTLFLLAFGLVAFAIGLPLAWPDPFWPDDWVMMFTEAVVIISLMSAGLKIGRAFSIDNWKDPLRLLLITMPLCIVAGVVLGYYFLGLPLETAVLLGAVLAPTDPVMASEVQVEPDHKNDAERMDNVRFTLTGEAGLNDGLAFPFTWLAVVLAQAGGQWSEVALGKWVLDKVGVKITVGILVGLVLGYVVGWLVERLPKVSPFKTRDGFVALSATFLIYAASELLHGYGFLAVFVAGLTIRHVEGEDDQLMLRMHDFVSEIERLMLVLFLLLFGGSLLNGMLSGFGWEVWAFAAAFIFVVRPLAGMLGLVGSDLGRKGKIAVSFLGIRGIGSLFYLTWAFLHADFGEKDLVYHSLCVVVLVSIIAHSLSARSLMI